MFGYRTASSTSTWTSAALPRTDPECASCYETLSDDMATCCNSDLTHRVCHSCVRKLCSSLAVRKYRVSLMATAPVSRQTLSSKLYWTQYILSVSTKCNRYPWSMPSGMKWPDAAFAITPWRNPGPSISCQYSTATTRNAASKAVEDAERSLTLIVAVSSRLKLPIELKMSGIEWRKTCLKH